MITFKSLDDLKQIDKDHSAYALLDDLAHRLLVNSPEEGFFYDPEADGFLVLIDESDTDDPLIGIWDDWTLLDVPWEGVMQEDGFFKAIFLANNEFGIVFLIPDAEWVNGELREALEYHLDP